MGSTKQQQSSSGQQQQQTTYTPTAEETELNKLQLERARASQPGAMEYDRLGLDLANRLLRGDSLPGYFGGLPGGLSDSAITDISQQAVRDIQPQFQGQGLLDSGVNAAISGRTAADIRRQSYEYNQNLLLNLLNLSSGFGAQIQQPQIATSSMLSSRLQGLRSVNQTGSSSGTQSGKNSYDFFTSPFTLQMMQNAGNASKLAAGCWVASEIFGGWNKFETVMARYYMNLKAPKWLKDNYIKYGQNIAKFIKNKPILKAMLKPVFKYFVWSIQNGK